GVQEAGVDEDADVRDPRQAIGDLTATILDSLDEAARGDGGAGQQAELGDRPLDLADRVAGRGVDARPGPRSGRREVALVRIGCSDDQVGPRPADGADVDRVVGLPQNDAASDAEAVDDGRCAGVEDGDSPGRGFDDDRPLCRHRHRVQAGVGAGRLLALAAGGRAEQERDGNERRYATHCQRAHWVTATPSMIELTTMIAVCTRGRPPRVASARKQGNRTIPNRGIESSGHRSLGTLSGIARLTAAKRPYGAPKRRHAIAVSATSRTRKANASRLTAATRIGSASRTGDQ